MLGNWRVGGRSLSGVCRVFGGCALGQSGTAHGSQSPGNGSVKPDAPHATHTVWVLSFQRPRPLLQWCTRHTTHAVAIMSVLNNNICRVAQ